MNLENPNKIIISKHAIQRREHQNLIDKDILINLVKQIDDALILITSYFFHKYDYKIDNINLKVSVAVSKEDRKLNRDMNRGMIHKIYRTNFLNKKVECGVICAVKNSKNSKDKIQKEDFKYKLILDWKLFLKYQDIPMKHYHLYFNDFEEISNIAHLENEEFILNDFKRKD